MINPEDKRKELGSVLRDSREASGLSCQKFSQISGIPEDLIIEFEAGDYKRISSAPYLKGILKKYSRFAEIDYQEALKLAESLKTSGRNDTLPANRFSSRMPLKLSEFNPAILLFLALIFYFGFQFAVLAMPPKIILNDMPETVAEASLLISGRVVGKVKNFYINREKTELKNSGFSKNVYLGSEINVIEFQAVNFFGREVVVKKTVILKNQ